jgi:hypothetical protein
MLDRAKDLLLTRTELVDVLARSIVVQVTVKRLERWADAQRGARLPREGWSNASPCRPQYCLGDV